jgi:hypothetical protein
MPPGTARTAGGDPGSRHDASGGSTPVETTSGRLPRRGPRGLAAAAPLARRTDYASWGVGSSPDRDMDAADPERGIISDKSRNFFEP